MDTTGISSRQQIDSRYKSGRMGLILLHFLLGVCIPLLLFFGVSFTLITFIAPAIRQLPTWLFIHHTLVVLAGWALLTAGSIAAGLRVMRWMMRVGKELCWKAERKMAL